MLIACSSALAHSLIPSGDRIMTCCAGDGGERAFPRGGGLGGNCHAHLCAAAAGEAGPHHLHAPQHAAAPARGLHSAVWLRCAAAAAPHQVGQPPGRAPAAGLPAGARVASRMKLRAGAASQPVMFRQPHSLTGLRSLDCGQLI